MKGDQYVVLQKRVRSWPLKTKRHIGLEERVGRSGQHCKEESTDGQQHNKSPPEELIVATLGELPLLLVAPPVREPQSLNETPWTQEALPGSSQITTGYQP